MKLFTRTITFPEKELQEELQKLQEEFDEMRETITRQHALLWMVGLDRHEDEAPQSEEKSIANLRALLRDS